MTTEETPHWDPIARLWEQANPQVLWRVHSDAVNTALLERWLPTGQVGRLLKTDLFDEAFSSGLYPFLAVRAQSVVGIDVSELVVRASRSRYTGLLVTVADVRRLPFAEGAFDIIVSISTLDHFESFNDIAVGVCELRRVLRPGGQLILTLDNLAHPLIALRNLLPFHLLHRLGLVPYYVGPTCGPRRLRRILSEAHLEVLEISAVMHCPRVFAVPVSKLFERHTSPKTQKRFLRFLIAFECLERWPSRFLSGHFVAVRAIKR